MRLLYLNTYTFAFSAYATPVSKATNITVTFDVVQVSVLPYPKNDLRKVHLFLITNEIAVWRYEEMT